MVYARDMANVAPPPQKVSLAPGLIALDAFGSVLVGLGLAKVFAGIEVIPAAWRFDQYEFMFIGAGAALMLPTVVSVLKQVAAHTPRSR